MTPKYSIASASAAEAGEVAAPASPFVLNLCSSTTPMALAQTELPELKRFTFFVSRRFEEGRERFRLHMGYFATLAEAEEWLGVVREIYPGAWAGEAPGRRLRERATAAAAAQARHAAGPQPRIPVVHAAPPAPARSAAPRSSAPRARLAPSGAAPVRPAPAAPRVPSLPPAVRAAVPRLASARPASPAPPVLTPRAGLPPARPAPPAHPLRVAAATAPPAARSAPATGRSLRRAFEDSNVREVLVALGDASATGETRLMRVPPPPLSSPASAESPSLSDTQVLRMLETRRPAGAAAPPADAAHGGIRLLKPDDTGTRRALKEAVVNNAPVSFAVQLQWSAHPAELDRVPPLAIFSAYTLYTVEGSRDGRRWYGLRLGFFSDALSAKQVAYYVRSDFTSVAVVPVSPQEKQRATDQDNKAATLAGPPATRTQSGEFKLIDESVADIAVAALLQSKVPAKPAKGAARAAPRVAVGRSVAQPAPAKGRARGARVGAREHRAPQTLEETLEILGASELTIDTGNGETLNDSGVRHLRVEVQKNSPFTRLLDRLSERMRKS